MQLVFGSDNALTGGSLLLSVYLYEQHIERSTQVVGGGVICTQWLHTLFRPHLTVYIIFYLHTEIQ